MVEHQLAPRAKADVVAGGLWIAAAAAQAHVAQNDVVDAAGCVARNQVAERRRRERGVVADLDALTTRALTRDVQTAAANDDARAQADGAADLKDHDPVGVRLATGQRCAQRAHARVVQVRDRHDLGAAAIAGGQRERAVALGLGKRAKGIKRARTGVGRRARIRRDIRRPRIWRARIRRARIGRAGVGRVIGRGRGGVTHAVVGDVPGIGT